MDGLAFLDKSDKTAQQPIYVLLGDEEFLKRRCREAILKKVLGPSEADFAVSNYSGDQLALSTAINDLTTVAFLAPVRVVLVEAADAFITANRDGLERYAAKPSKIGVLVLEVKTFPESTKLAKALPDASKLACKAPAPYKLPEWLVKWAKLHHGKALQPDAAEVLLDLVGTTLGLLDAELAKLAVAAGTGGAITPELVRTHVTRSSGANVFHILDAIGDGRPGHALNLLHRLLEDGEAELAILGALSYQLRKLAGVHRLLSLGQSLGQAMDEAGVAKWPQARQSAEKQLRHLGKDRLAKLTDWLVEVNLGLKGGSALPERTQLERLVVRLATAS